MKRYLLNENKVKGIPDITKFVFESVNKKFEKKTNDNIDTNEIYLRCEMIIATLGRVKNLKDKDGIENTISNYVNTLDWEYPVKL